jgi:hypothetical protein
MVVEQEWGVLAGSQQGLEFLSVRKKGGHGLVPEINDGSLASRMLGFAGVFVQPFPSRRQTGPIHRVPGPSAEMMGANDHGGVGRSGLAAASQASEPLPQRINGGAFRHEGVEVEISPHFQALGRHDESRAAPLWERRCASSERSRRRIRSLEQVPAVERP